MIELTYESVREKVQAQKVTQKNFEIFGFDFILDTDFKVWLLEVNSKPSLNTNDPVLKSIIPDMLEECF